MCFKILKIRKWYKIIDGNTLKKFEEEFKLLVQSACRVGTINKKTMEYLIVENPITPMFYALPKIHKNCDKLPG